MLFRSLPHRSRPSSSKSRPRSMRSSSSMATTAALTPKVARFLLLLFRRLTRRSVASRPNAPVAPPLPRAHPASSCGGDPWQRKNASQTAVWPGLWINTRKSGSERTPRCESHSTACSRECAHPVHTHPLAGIASNTQRAGCFGPLVHHPVWPVLTELSRSGSRSGYLPGSTIRKIAGNTVAPPPKHNAKASHRRTPQSPPTRDRKSVV